MITMEESIILFKLVGSSNNCIFADPSGKYKVITDYHVYSENNLCIFIENVS